MRGKAFLYYSGDNSALPTSPSWTDQGNQAGAAYGFSVAGDADINADGKKDIAIGGPYYDTTANGNEGIVRVYKGSTTGPVLLWYKYGASAGDWSGYSLAFGA